MKHRPSLTWSLIALLVLLAVLSQLVSAWQAREMLASTIRERELDKARTLGSLIEELIVEASGRVSLAAALLKYHEPLAHAVAQAGVDGSATLVLVLDQLFVESKLDLMEVTDDQEMVLYRAHAKERKSERDTSWGVAEALSGTAMLSTSVGPSGLAIRAVEPLHVDGRIVGTVTVGTHLNETFMQRLSQKVGAGLALIGRTSPVAFSHPVVATHLDPSAMKEAFHQKIPIYRHDGQTHFTTLYLPMLIVDEGVVIVARISSAAAYTGLDKRLWYTTQFVAMMLGLSIALGILVLRWLLTPLRALRRRAEQSAVAITGEQIARQGGDEITSVVHALEVLTDRLMARNAELDTARSAAEAANAAKSEFLSTMSHEIRTPLNGVLGMAELLTRTPLNDVQHTYCEAIRTSGHTLYTLLSDILDLAKIEAGKVELERLDFAPGMLCRDVVEVYRELAAGRGTGLTLELDPSLPARAAGDPTRLRQVLANLLSNAMKFTEGGGITVRVHTGAPRAGDTRTWLRFVVCDTGIGMPPEVLRTLFQPFTQADASTTRKHGGTGLGLSICRALVEMMGGTLEVESTPGEGSTFRFAIPLDAAAEPETQPPTVNTGPQHCAARVLVVEDNEVNQVMIQAMLDVIGASSRVVGDGAAAVAAIQCEPFDIVLMDCQMPIMDGFAATAQIRAMETPRRHTPIIALTANALAGDRQRCLEAGMDDYLTKPIPLDTLSAVLARWMPPAAGPGNAPKTTPAPAALPGSAGVSPPPLDQTPLQGLRALQRPGGPDILAKVLRTYLTSTPPLLATLRQALTAGDATAVQQTAHRLKSGSAQVGALALSAHCQTLEAMGRAQTLDQAAAVLAAIEAQYPAVQAALTLEIHHPSRQTPAAAQGSVQDESGSLL